MKNNDMIYIVLDESGAMHLQNTRYFVIAGYITSNILKVRKSHRKTEELIRKEKCIESDKELKASFLYPKNKAEFINNVLEPDFVTPIGIIVDKNALRKKVIEENIAYNLLVKTLLTYLLKFYPNLLFYNDIMLILDNRSIKIKYTKQLETYLEWEIGNTFNKNFIVVYKDSKTCREVQIADYIANVLFGRYNYINYEKTSSLIPKFNSILISKFPYKNFEEPEKKHSKKKEREIFISK